MIYIEMIFSILCIILTAVFLIAGICMHQVTILGAAIGLLLISIFVGMFWLLVRELREDNDNNEPTF